MRQLLSREVYTATAVSAAAIVARENARQDKTLSSLAHGMMAASINMLALDVLTALDVIDTLKAEVADLNAQLVDAKNDAAEARGTLPNVEWR